ncbi:MAG TPA: restriction endonuclease subunit S [Pyrinomonadaceae bacterium]|nr:restriction endonuclease subunit S [Pyrinomonadaceae bacterium]
MPLLKDIATIQIGYHFRDQIKPVKGGTYKLIQIKDVSRIGLSSVEKLINVNIDDLKPEQVLRKGDVILVGRGERRLAVAITDDSTKATVGSQFFIIRANHLVDPSYLSWALNQDSAQRYLQEQSVGTNVKIVSKEAISYLPIILPGIGTQRTIASLHSLNEKQRHLMNTIAERSYRLTEQTLLSLIDPDMKGSKSDE